MRSCLSLVFRRLCGMPFHKGCVRVRPVEVRTEPAELNSEGLQLITDGGRSGELRKAVHPLGELDQVWKLAREVRTKPKGTRLMESRGARVEPRQGCRCGPRRITGVQGRCRGSAGEVEGRYKGVVSHRQASRKPEKDSARDSYPGAGNAYGGRGAWADGWARSGGSTRRGRISRGPAG